MRLQRIDGMEKRSGRERRKEHKSFGDVLLAPAIACASVEARRSLDLCGRHRPLGIDAHLAASVPVALSAPRPKHGTSGFHKKRIDNIEKGKRVVTSEWQRK